MKVLLLGADGFIGRHVAFFLRGQGVEVIACARCVSRLEQMGFATLRADLGDPQTHDPAFWRSRLAGGVHVVNCAGLLTGPETAFRTVHICAPKAVLAARDGGHLVHISAVGIDHADTPFAQWRREGEARLTGQSNVTVLRPGLVLGETSYGGSSALRAFAALPFLRPVVGTGTQPFNPVHASDLATVIFECLSTPPGFGPYDIGGPETLSQSQLGAMYRRWLGLRAVPELCLPSPVARVLGRLGDWLALGPISSTAVAQLDAGVLADPTDLLQAISKRPRSATAFIAARPAGTQDLWHARLYLLKPLTRLVLAVMWLGSGVVGLMAPMMAVIATVPSLPAAIAMPLARSGGVVDPAIGVALLTNWQPKATAIAQFLVVAGYTLGLSILSPGLWLDPIGGMLKNLPVLALLLIHLALVDER
ncbi:SDR family oxidoreductase [Thioclava sp.]|uniref:SDR family oxidoreductase n=1 Tax=Thioclava sp. TaxID=1933450 RepID=UPI003AA8D4DD